MKLDFLTPAQWKSVLSLTQAMHSDLERRMGRGFLRCGNCGERQPLTARLVKQYLEEEGFPVHCSGTLKGGTMNFYASEANLERELALEGATHGS